jgi:hypothetical protein
MFLSFKRAWVRSCGRMPFILISFPSIFVVSRQDVTYKHRRVFSHPFQFANDNIFSFKEVFSIKNKKQIIIPDYWYSQAVL